MNREELLKFIQNTGYRAIREIKANFPDSDEELLNMNLTYLVDKNKIKKAQFRVGAEESTLYYIHVNCQD